MTTIISQILSDKNARTGTIKAPAAQSEFSPWDTL